MKQNIKGMCENCGFCYKGEMEVIDGEFRDIKCSECGKETQNFDESSVVDELNIKDGHGDIVYIETTLQYIKN